MPKSVGSRLPENLVICVGHVGFLGHDWDVPLAARQLCLDRVVQRPSWRAHARPGRVNLSRASVSRRNSRSSSLVLGRKLSLDGERRGIHPSSVTPR